MLGQVVLPHKALITDVTRKVPGTVCRFVFPQRRILAEAFATKLARVGGLLGVGPVMGQEF